MPVLQPEKSTLLKILEDDKLRYTVPQYQRGYSWEKESLDELWDDLTQTVYEKNSDHFMGILVFCETTDSGLLEIVDGQQRLVTTSILLRALYDNVKENDTDLADDIYEYIYTDQGFKIKLGESDEKFFQDHIQSKTASKVRKIKPVSHKRIIYAYKFFSERIAEYAGLKGLDVHRFVKDFFKKILKRTVVIKIVVDSDAEAYSIFESINSTGVDLTVSDLLKNFLFIEAKDKKELDVIKINWDSVQRNLEEHKIKVSQFIRHYWISAYVKVREKELYGSIKKLLKNKPDELTKFSQSLKTESEIYLNLLAPDESGYSESIVDLLKDINTLNIKQCYPLLLSWIATGNDIEKNSGLLKKIIGMTIRRGISKMNPNALEFFYAKWALDIRQNMNNVDDLLKAFDDSEYSVNDEDFKDHFLSSNFPSNYARFILEKFEESISTGEKKVFKPTLEHILPQKPENLDDWNVSEEQHDEYVYKIGNLALVGKRFNSAANNSDFDKKKKEYRKSDIKMIKQIHEEESWTMEKIDQRSEELFNFIVRKYFD